MDDVARFARGEGSLPYSAIVLTIDDGFRDFYLHAYPTLKRRGIPATMFLMTDFIDRVEWPWWDRLRNGFENTPLKALQFAVSPEQPAFSFAFDQTSRTAAYAKIAGILKKVPNRVRVEFLARMPEVFQIEVPKQAPAPLDPLTWDEVREMAANNITFGAHTKTHPVLSTIENESDIQEEIRGSKQRIEEETGIEVRHFCYPNGRYADIDERAIRCVQTANFSTAVTLEPGFVTPGSDPLQMSRLVFEPCTSLPYFRQRVAGIGV